MCEVLRVHGTCKLRCDTDGDEPIDENVWHQFKECQLSESGKNTTREKSEEKEEEPYDGPRKSQTWERKYLDEVVNKDALHRLRVRTLVQRLRERKPDSRTADDGRTVKLLLHTLNDTNNNETISQLRRRIVGMFPSKTTTQKQRMVFGRVLGQGAFGLVISVWLRESQEEFAVKVLKETDSINLRAFRQEIKTQKLFAQNQLAVDVFRCHARLRCC